jgi:hypothetical protein
MKHIYIREAMNPQGLGTVAPCIDFLTYYFFRDYLLQIHIKTRAVGYTVPQYVVV